MRQRLRIIGRDDPSPLARSRTQDLSDPTGIGGDDREARCEGLDRDHAECFAWARMNEQAGSPEGGGDALAVRRRLESNRTRDSEILGHPSPSGFDFLCRGRTDQPEHRPRPSRVHPRERPKQGLDALRRLSIAHEYELVRDPLPRLGQSELLDRHDVRNHDEAVAEVRDRGLELAGERLAHRDDPTGPCRGR